MRVLTPSFLGLVVAAAVVAGSWSYVRKDPRDDAEVAHLMRVRESSAFKDRLRRGLKEDWAWPGL
ncbi:MAG: hypothetical protein ABIR96_11490, partial [Bdellovibrionota bacterium]